MATGVNRVILIGYLGKDPETQNFENGLKKVSFSLATTESFKNKDGSQHTDYEDVYQQPNAQAFGYGRNHLK